MTKIKITIGDTFVLCLMGLSNFTSCSLFSDQIPTYDGDKYLEYVPEFYYTYFSNGVDAIKSGNLSQYVAGEVLYVYWGLYT